MTNELLIIRDKIGNKKQVSDTLYSTFREALATGVLKPGVRLREEELAELFHVSRTPVREAIKKLEIEGFISSDPVRGCIIRELKLDECLDTLEMLEWLRNASIDFLKGHIPRSILMMLEANLHHGAELSDPIQCYENNVEFHALLIRATGNTELIQITRRLEFKERIIVNNMLPYHYAENYLDIHRQLLKAIIDKDEAFINSYKEQNIAKATSYMNALIATFLEG